MSTFGCGLWAGVFLTWGARFFWDGSLAAAIACYVASFAFTAWEVRRNA